MKLALLKAPSAMLLLRHQISEATPFLRGLGFPQAHTGQVTKGKSAA